MDEQRQKSLAALAWAVSGPFGPLIPAVIYIRYAKESRFVGQHALQAALSYVYLLAGAIIYGLVLGAMTAIYIAMHGVPQMDAQPPAVMTISAAVGAGLLSLVYVGLVITGFIYAARARQGRWPRYPFVDRIAATIAPPPKQEPSS